MMMFKLINEFHGKYVLLGTVEDVKKHVMKLFWKSGITYLTVRQLLDDIEVRFEANSEKINTFKTLLNKVKKSTVSQL